MRLSILPTPSSSCLTVTAALSRLVCLYNPYLPQRPRDYDKKLIIYFIFLKSLPFQVLILTALHRQHLVRESYGTVYAVYPTCYQKKKGEPLGRLSRSSGCIYLTQYIIMGMGCVTPYLRKYLKIVLRSAEC